MRKVAASLAMMLAFIGSAFAGPYDGWSKYRTITVNTTTAGVATTQSNFPLLVRLTSASAATGSDVLADDATGASLRFASSDGETAYDYEIETWTASAAAVWVRVPTIAGNSNTTIRLYWGKDGASSESSPNNVFQTSNGFRAVYHLNNAPGDSARDATSNNYHMQALSLGAGSVVPQDTIGMIGMAKNFLGFGTNGNASGGYYRRASADAPRLQWTGDQQFTLSVWVYGDSVQGTASANRRGILGKYTTATTSTQQYILATIQTPANTATQLRFQGAARNISATGGNFRAVDAEIQQWHHFAYTRTGTATANAVTYLNGVAAFATTGQEGTGATASATPIVIGAYSNPDRFWNGKIDEARFDSTARSADWIKLNYETQKAAVTAVALGETQTQGGGEPTVPGAPTGVSGTAGDGQVSVAFTAPSSDGGAAITGYTVTSDPGGFSNTGASSPIVVSGLTNGVGYTFTVTATNSVGTGSASSPSSSVTPRTVPGAPTGVSGTAGDGQVSVVFTAPSSDGGAAITGYTVTSDPGGFSNTGASSPIVVSGLTNGVGYTFTVTATNSVGTGAASSPSSSVTPVAAAVVPGAPTGVVGTAGDGQVSVAFAAPSSDGGAAITGYTVISDPGGFSNTGAASPIVVSGLANGTGYTFTVTATNSVGTGAASSPSSSVTPRTVPGAPTNVVGTAGDAQVSVAFTAPSSDGGAAITGYTVTSDPGGFSNTGAASPIVVGGLTNGVGYTFTVAATNAAGPGPASSPSSSVTPEASTTPYGAWAHSRAIILNTSASGANVTGAVANIPILVRLGSNEAAVFSQAKPGGADIRFSRSGGTQPLAYEIEHWDAGTQRAAIWVLLDNVLGNNASQSITLHWGNAGAGSESDPNAVFSTANGHRAVYHLNDAPGDSARDATSNNYHMQAGTTGSVVPQDTLGVIGVGKNFVGGGTNGNAVGGYYLRTSAASPRLQWTGDQQFTLSVWVYGDSVQGTASANRRGILGKYTVATTSTQQYLLATIQTPANTATQLRFQGAARNISATGGNFRAVDAEIQQWHHLAYTRTGTATANAVTYLNGVAAFATTGSEGTGATASATPIVIGAYSNLDRFWNGKLDEARFDSTARSANYIKLSYESQRPNQSLTDIGLPGGSPTVPGVPTGVAGTPGGAGSGQVAVNWTAPVSDGGSAITAYTATAATSPGGVSSGTCGWTAGPLTCTVGSLTGGSSYTFTVVATNGVGTGAASAASSPVLVPVGVVPGSVVFRVSGGARPYTFVLPAGSPASDAVTMRITDLWGRTVWSGTLRASEEGARALTWNGRSSSGRAVSAGMYVARVTVVRDGKATELSGKGVTLKPQ